MKIRSFGEKLATIGARDSLGVTVAANEQPYGQFQFPSEEFTVTIGICRSHLYRLHCLFGWSCSRTDETKGDNIQVARLAVERFNGRFDQSNVTWTVEDNVDLTPQSGSLVFDIGVEVMYIELTAVDDIVSPVLFMFYTVSRVAAPDPRRSRDIYGDLDLSFRAGHSG